MNSARKEQYPVFHIAVILAVLFSTGVPIQAPAGPQDSQVATRTAEQAWHDSMGLIQHGHFEDATLKLSQVAASNASVARLAKWLDDWTEQAQMRVEMTLADYEKYVRWSRKYHDKQDYAKALDYAMRAYNNAVSKEAFREEAWVTALTDDALEKASELRKEKEWLEALSLYYEVGAIFENDPELRQRMRECRTHARLDAIYTEESKWEERLTGIERRMVEEAFREVDQKYVETADFRALTEAGLEQMLLLTESKSLRSLFEVLEEDDQRKMFNDRIRANLYRVRDSRTTVDFTVAREQFRNALRINRQTIQLPEALVINEYMEGCLEELDDFTTMIWPASIREFEKHTRGDFVGVGIQIRKNHQDEIVVVSPIEDSPAYRAGVQAGDIITGVNGKSLEDFSLNKAVDTITGPKGTSVNLSIRRDGEAEELDFVLKRSKIKIQSIKGFARDDDDDQEWQYMIDPEHGIAYVRVVSFQENTVEDFIKTIDRLSQDRLRGLVLDLRLNPGGLLQSAVRFSELFLDTNERIVSTRGLNSPVWPIDARRRGPYRDLPLVVLVNESSASASEIVAGAIKDHKRGLIVGDRTFGKFSVQNLIQLAHTDAHLKLTTARYYLPSGRSLHRDDDSVEWGVEPDIHVPLVAKETIKIWQGFRKRDIIGSHADALAEKVLSDEEADLKAAVERARDSGEKDEDTAPSKTEATGDPADETGNDDDSAAPDEAAEEEEIDSNDRPDIDPQLDAALLAMRAHLLNLSYQLAARSDELSEVEVRSK